MDRSTTRAEAADADAPSWQRRSIGKKSPEPQPKPAAVSARAAALATRMAVPAPPPTAAAAAPRAEPKADAPKPAEPTAAADEVAEEEVEAEEQPGRRKPWTPAEVRLLKKGFRKHGHKWASILADGGFDKHRTSVRKGPVGCYSCMLPCEDEAC
eukprot:6184620-Pleurochrysis_carterae.AAC.4